MFLMRHLLVTSSVTLLALGSRSAEPAPELKTRMTERGKPVLAEDLRQPLGSDWKTAKGKWEIADGVLKGSELKADMHGAVTRRSLPLHNAIIQYSFKLDGARQTTLSINDPKGHCCRLVITADGFAVQKDSHDHNMKDKAAVLDRCATPIKPGEWHTIVLEIQGKEMLACLDGKAVALGSHESIDVDKANIGLTVAGESVSFRDLRVWEAAPAKDWEATRAKLLEGRAAK